MDWSKNDALRLAELYRNKPVLWDTRLNEYKERSSRLVALREIAEELGIDKAEVERKLKNLLCHFSREVKKERQTAATPLPFKSQWFCYKSLEFLKERCTNYNANQDFSQIATYTDGEDSNQYQKLPTTSAATPEAAAPSSSPHRPITHAQSTSSWHHHQNSIEDTDSARTHRDSYSAFGEYVGQQLRDLPSDNARKIAKHLINNVLFEAEMGRLDDLKVVKAISFRDFLEGECRAKRARISSPERIVEGDGAESSVVVKSEVEDYESD